MAAIGQTGDRPVNGGLLYAIAAGIACVFAVVWLFAAGAFEPGISLYWADKDFANYWTAAQLVFDGQTQDLFAPHATYFAHMQAFFGPDYPWHNWSYPPHYLFTVVPLGFLAYKPALVAYLLVTFLICLACLRHLRPHAPLMSFLLLIAAVAANVSAAQNGFLTATLLLAGLALRDSKPILAGIFIGLLTVKPQLGFLLPLLLLYERNWRVIASAAVTTTVLVGASAAAFGLQSWQGYINDVIPYQAEVMREAGGIFPYMMPSVFGAMRSLGFDAGTAMTTHLPVAVAGFGFYLWTLIRLKDADGRMVSTILATFVVTPYSVSYDLVPIAAIGALWPFGNTAAEPRGNLRIVFWLMALTPMSTPLLGLAGLPVTPLIIAAAWALFAADQGAFRTNGTGLFRRAA